MRGADASAGTIKSGGKTRRAAKMVVLDIDHPDVEEFIWCKAKEERKARVLEQAGYDMTLDSADWASIQYQNANNSVRVTDAFMEAVVEGKDWGLTARTDGSVVETVDARGLLRQISEAAWQCADPGVQYDTTINSWHTLPNTGRINASNPCSEYMSIDDSACNLSSLNLMKFRREDGEFDVTAFEHAVDVMFLAQELARVCRLDDRAVGAGGQVPLLALDDGLHEGVADADRVVRVLVLDRAPVRRVERHVVARLLEDARLPLLLGLAPDELLDIRVVDVEDDHLRRTPRLAA
jgi:hypothetical protein